MKATIVDLRYKMNDVLKALDRNEPVVLYRGKVKGTLVGKKTCTKMTDQWHLIVKKIMDELRGVRHRDICGYFHQRGSEKAAK